MYQPKTGAKCSCKRGVQRDNCAACEGTGWRVDFAKIRERIAQQRSAALESPDDREARIAMRCEKDEPNR